ncbi:unnamed protein product, partial [Amoebophrya sp. A120]
KKKLSLQSHPSTHWSDSCTTSVPSSYTSASNVAQPLPHDLEFSRARQQQSRNACFSRTAATSLLSNYD